MISEPRSGKNHSPHFLVSAKSSLAMDAEAQTDWGFNTFALIESAGRSCAQVFYKKFRDFFKNKPRITVASGSGNNGADAMAMLRYLILSGYLTPSHAFVVVTRMPKRGDSSPWVGILTSLKKMKVPVLVWDGDLGEGAGRPSDDILAQSDIIIDGITGTGIKCPLKGAAKEMTDAINFHKKNSSFLIPHSTSNKNPFVVSLDLPSGNSDEWKPGMPIIDADVTLAIEPQKHCIYTPAARPHAGMILPVGAVFPGEIIKRYAEAEILDWEGIQNRIPKVRPSAYKGQRGTVEIHAGSPGAAGAAFIAARGAQAAGAGLIRLLVDEEIYPIIASKASGIMVIPPGAWQGWPSAPDAILLGPGWGKNANRVQIFEQALAVEKKGTPLILDADAIELSKDKKFNGNVILTPHPGEFCNFTGVGKEELLSRPLPILLKYASACNAVILFKGHVITIASPDGRVGIVDGMTPVLATGGSGDLLAGLCVAIAARMVSEGRGFDAYTCAVTASALLIASGKSKGFKSRFSDPLELANRAADLAGKAWL